VYSVASMKGSGSSAPSKVVQCKFSFSEEVTVALTKYIPKLTGFSDAQKNRTHISVIEYYHV
jgi:hypothetical protein